MESANASLNLEVELPVQALRLEGRPVNYIHQLIYNRAISNLIWEIINALLIMVHLRVLAFGFL